MEESLLAYYVSSVQQSNIPRCSGKAPLSFLLRASVRSSWILKLETGEQALSTAETEPQAWRGGEGSRTVFHVSESTTLTQEDLGVTVLR